MSIGGALSLLARIVFPNLIRRKQLRSRLTELDSRLQKADSVFGPQAITILRMARRRLTDRTAAVSWVSSDAASDWQSLASDVALLERRIMTAERVRALARSIQMPAGAGLGWFATRKVMESCRAAMSMLADADQDPSTTRDAIRQTNAIIDRAGDVEHGFTELDDRGKRIAGAVGLLAADSDWKALTARATWFPGRFAALDYEVSSGSEQVVKETAVLSIEQMLGLHRCRRSLRGKTDEILLALQNGTWEDLLKA